MTEGTDVRAAVRLAEKHAAKRKAQQESKPIADRINDRGKVKIWHVHDQKFIDVWPVDASDMIRRGIALLDKPTVEDVIIEEDPNSKEDPNNDPSEPKPQDERLNEMTVPELKALAAINDVDLKGLTKPADIIKAIGKANKQVSANVPE